MILYSFIFMLLLITAVGLLSSIKKNKDTRDYVLASNNTSPWLLGLSTFATNNSGFMFTAIIGYGYTVGLSAIWITFPWILGDFLANYIFLKRMYNISNKNNSLTYIDLLTKSNNENYKYLRVIASILVIVFLGVQASAQFKATSYAFSSLLSWGDYTGAIITAIIAFLYCVFGGLRASIWTDFLQSIIMFCAMLILCVVLINKLGGIQQLWVGMNSVSPTFMNFFPENNTIGVFWGGFFIIIGYIIGGAGFIGQPHLVVRYMAMRSVKDIWIVRGSYYIGYIVFACIVFTVAFATKVFIGNIDDSQKEFMLFLVSKELLPAILVGVILAGLFSAAVSTIDSQVLSCASTLVNDLNIGKKSYLYNKIGTFLIISLALCLSIINADTIFNIIFSAWSVLSCAFMPLIMVRSFNGRISEKLSIIMIITSLIGMYVWVNLGYSSTLYEVLPGVVVGMLTYFLLYKRV